MLPDLLLGLSLIFWAIAGIWQNADQVAALFPVRLSLATLQCFVGIQLLMRVPALEQGSLRALVVSLPSFLVSGLLFRLSEPLADWPTLSKWIFSSGVLGVILSFWSLGRSFAIFPARRAIVRGGAYRLLRHPAYCCELIMAAACACAGGSIIAALVFLALIPLMVLRILQEEKLLLHDSAYLDYTQQTKWRLIPLIW